MQNEPLQPPRDAPAVAFDLPITHSVALRRLITEVRQQATGSVCDTTLYNRTYHRHNR